MLAFKVAEVELNLPGTLNFPEEEGRRVLGSVP